MFFIAEGSSSEFHVAFGCHVSLVTFILEPYPQSFPNVHDFDPFEDYGPVILQKCRSIWFV